MTIDWLLVCKKVNSGCNDFHISSIIVITDFDRMKEQRKCKGAYRLIVQVQHRRKRN
jgi:hypothetical protein